MKLIRPFLLVFIALLISQPLIAQEAGVAPSGMKWYSMEEAQKLAKENDKKVMIFGYADWCTYCRKMRKEVYPDSAMQSTIYRDFYPVQLNGESPDTVVFNGEKIPAVQLARYLRLSSYPTHYFVKPDGEVFLAQDGFIPVGTFIPMVEYVGTDAYKEMGFGVYMNKKNKNESGN